MTAASHDTVQQLQRRATTTSSVILTKPIDIFMIIMVLSRLPGMEREQCNWFGYCGGIAKTWKHPSIQTSMNVLFSNFSCGHERSFVTTTAIFNAK